MASATLDFEVAIQKDQKIRGRKKTTGIIVIAVLIAMLVWSMTMFFSRSRETVERASVRGNENQAETEAPAGSKAFENFDSADWLELIIMSQETRAYLSRNVSDENATQKLLVKLVNLATRGDSERTDQWIAALKNDPAAGFLDWLRSNALEGISSDHKLHVQKMMLTAAILAWRSDEKHILMYSFGLCRDYFKEVALISDVGLEPEMYDGQRQNVLRLIEDVVKGHTGFSDHPTLEVASDDQSENELEKFDLVTIRKAELDVNPQQWGYLSEQKKVGSDPTLRWEVRRPVNPVKNLSLWSITKEILKLVVSGTDRIGYYEPAKLVRMPWKNALQIQVCSSVDYWIGNVLAAAEKLGTSNNAYGSLKQEFSVFWLKMKKELGIEESPESWTQKAEHVFESESGNDSSSEGWWHDANFHAVKLMV